MPDGPTPEGHNSAGRTPEGRLSQQPEKKGSPWDDLLRYGGLGVELFGSVIVGAFLGWYIDNLLKLKTPWFLLAGVILGAIAGFRDIYRLVKQEEVKEKQQQEARQEARQEAQQLEEQEARQEEAEQEEVKERKR